MRPDLTDMKETTANSTPDRIMTIVVPVYNRSGLVLRCLDSIAAQTYRPLRLIIVDNHSTDRTPEVLEKWKRVNATPQMEVTLLDEPRRGASVARQTGFNYALTQSGGDYVMFFDSDDTMEPGLVERAMKTFDMYPDLDIVSWAVRIHGLDKKVHRSHTSGDSISTHMVHSLLRTQGYAVRKDYFRRHGGWNTDLGGWDDWELGVRLLLGTPRMKIVGMVPVDVYCREDSITGKDFSSKEGEWERALDAAEEAIRKSEDPAKVKLLRWVNYRRAILAAHYNREGNLHAAVSLMRHVRGEVELGRVRRLFLRLVYAYTSRGGRGAGLPARFML